MRIDSALPKPASSSSKTSSSGFEEQEQEAKKIMAEDEPLSKEESKAEALFDVASDSFFSSVVRRPWGSTSHEAHPWGALPFDIEGRAESSDC